VEYEIDVTTWEDARDSKQNTNIPNRQSHYKKSTGLDKEELINVIIHQFTVDQTKGQGSWVWDLC
jgi:hypothetical protein